MNLASLAIAGLRLRSLRQDAEHHIPTRGADEGES